MRAALPPSSTRARPWSRLRSIRTTLALAAVVLAGALALAGDPTSWERHLARWFYDRPSPPDGLIDVVMFAGTRPAVVVVAIALALTSRRATALAVLAAGLGGWAVVTVLKDVVDRARPTAASLGQVPRDVVSSGAFPSAHTAVVVAIVAVLLLGSRPPSRLVAGLAVAVTALVGLGRVHLGVHWPVDIVGGVAVGVLVAALAVLAVDRR